MVVGLGVLLVVEFPTHGYKKVLHTMFKWFMNHDVSFSISMIKLKALLHMNILNDVTAAPFLVSFSQLPAAKKTTKMVPL